MRRAPSKPSKISARRNKRPNSFQKEWVMPSIDESHPSSSYSPEHSTGLTLRSSKDTVPESHIRDDFRESFLFQDIEMDCEKANESILSFRERQAPCSLSRILLFIIISPYHLFRMNSFSAETTEVNVTLPHSMTTWLFQSVSVNPRGGICAAPAVRVPVEKNLFLQVDMPYKVVQNEHVMIKVSVYNYRRQLTTGKFSRGRCLYLRAVVRMGRRRYECVASPPAIRNLRLRA